MPVKIVDVDIQELKSIEGLDGYEAVEILFRAGREPLGRARVPCNGNSLDAESIRPLIEDLPSPEPLDIPGDSLSTISVAICTMNRIGELRKALHSLARQERPADEILVIDNGCQDEVRELVTQILPNARYLQEPRAGLDFARNRALSAATGDIIAFLDDDAVADSFWVQSLAECFAEFPGAGAVTGLILPLEIETDAQELFEANSGYARGFSRRVLPRDRARRFGLRLPLVAESISVGSGCNMAFRTEVLKKLDGFDEALDTGAPLPGGGDLDMFYRVMREGYEHIYEPRALVRHCHRHSQAEVQAQLAGHYRSLTAFLMKSLGVARGREWFWVIIFLIWRLSKVGFRIFRRLIGRDVLPIGLLTSMFKSGLVGIGSYHASRKRIQDQTIYSGDDSKELKRQIF